MSSNVFIGGRLRQERERLGLNQQELALVGGVTRKTQYSYEAGVRQPDTAYLARVAARGVDIAWVVKGEVRGAAFVAFPTPQDGLQMHTVGSRLKSERERLGLSQSAFAERCGSKKTSQINYEANRRHPGSDYLSAAAEIGADVLFVITGNRSAGAPVQAPDGPSVVRTGSGALELTAEERALIDNYRHAGDAGRRAIEAASAALAKPPGEVSKDAA